MSWNIDYNHNQDIDGEYYRQTAKFHGIKITVFCDKEKRDHYYYFNNDKESKTGPYASPYQAKTAAFYEILKTQEIEE